MKKTSENPEHNSHLIPPEEKEEMEKAQLYDHHKRAGSLGLFYDMYPRDRPVEWEHER